MSARPGLSQGTASWEMRVDPAGLRDEQDSAFVMRSCVIKMDHTPHAAQMIIFQTSCRSSVKLQVYPTRHRSILPQAKFLGGWDWRTIMIAGSNGGANARCRAQCVDGRHLGSAKYIGTGDLRNDVD